MILLCYIIQNCMCNIIYRLGHPVASTSFVITGVLARIVIIYILLFVLIIPNKRFQFHV